MKKMAVLRTFELSDLKDVQKIARSSLRERYSLDVYLCIHQATNCDFMVYTSSQDVVGFICGIVGSPDGGRILMLAVHPKHRFKGIGSELLNTFIHHCANQGTKRIRLEVRPSNSRAISFYQKRGFKIQGSIDNFYTDGERCITMVRYL